MPGGPVSAPVDLELLLHLAGRPGPGRWRGWEVTPVTGGRNALLYRATGPGGDLAVKFTVRDERDRAGREFGALRALTGAGLAIAPQPLFLDRDLCETPVVVQQWLAGTPLDAPPSDDAGWERVAELLELLYQVRPSSVAVELLPAAFNARSFGGAVTLVREELALLPPSERPQEVVAAAERLEVSPPPDWSPGEPALCHCDANTSNILTRPRRWAVVDWENAGWGDPAFDIADLIVHPAYRAVGEDRWQWLLQRLCGLNEGMRARVEAYRSVLAVWWAARVARALYEWPRGRDRRLAAPQPDWEARLHGNYAYYLALMSTV